MVSALPASPYSQKSHFGIAITGASLRGLSLNPDGTVQKKLAISLAESLITDTVEHPDHLVTAIQQLLQQGGFTAKYVAVCLPEKHAFSREYTLPTIKREEIGEAIGWQVEKIFPFKKEEIYTDWRLLSQSKTESVILVTAIQKKLLDQLQESFEAAGLSPISFEPSASALSRAGAPVPRDGEGR